MTFDPRPELDPWWAAARQAGRRTAVHSIHEGAYNKEPLEEGVHRNLAILPLALDPRRAARNQEAQDRNMAEDNIPLLAVAERVARKKAQEVWSQNLVPYRSVAANLALRPLQ
jgi:hypothetical protein